MPRTRRTRWCWATLAVTLLGTASLFVTRHGVTHRPNAATVDELEEMTLADFDEDADDGGEGAAKVQGTKASYEYEPVPSQPVITLFTVMEDTADRHRSNVNTLLNWDALYPGLRPVLVSPYDKRHSSLHRVLKQLTKHWKVVLTLDVIGDLPVLQGMFQVVENTSSSTPFVGYADSGTVFDSSILATLQGILSHTARRPDKATLIIGRGNEMINHQMAPPGCLPCITRLSATTTFSAKLDYFILLRRPGFPWDGLHRLPVRRDLFESSLLSHAVMNDVLVIDATLTLFAIHQGAQQERQFGESLAEKATMKTWPRHVQCPKVFAQKCLTLDISA